MQAGRSISSFLPLLRQTINFFTSPASCCSYSRVFIPGTSHFYPYSVITSLFGMKALPQVEDEEVTQRIYRKRFSYNRNQSIARSLEIKGISQQQPLSIYEDPNIQDAIGDHALRRVLLFYYSSVIYFGAKCSISRARTLLQHGMANFRWSSSAHSAILTNLFDDFFDLLRRDIEERGITIKSQKILEALGVSSDKMKSYTDVEDLLSEIDTENGLLNHESDFYDNLNSTVELPHEVNIFDTVIEGIMRKKALEILNQTSQENLHPYDALEMFVDEMHAFFNRCEESTLKKIKILNQIYKNERYLSSLEKNFTPNNVEEYLKTAKKLGFLYQQIKQLRPYTIPVNLRNRLTWQKRSLSCTLKNFSKHYTIINQLIQNNPPWTPKPIKAHLQSLQNSLKILKLQKGKTILPPFEFLSGKFLNGRLTPLTNQELFEQKLRLIKR